MNINIATNIKINKHYTLCNANIVLAVKKCYK